MDELEATPESGHEGLDDSKPETPDVDNVEEPHELDLEGWEALENQALETPTPDGEEDEEEVEAPEPKAPAAPKVPAAPSPETVRAAKRLGYTDAQIEKFSAAGVLEDVLGTGGDAPAEEDDEADEKAGDKKDRADDDDSGAEDDSGIPDLPEEYEEPLVQAFSATKKVIAELKEEVRQQREYFREMQLQTAVSEADQVVQQSGLADIFGTGPGKLLSPDSKELKNRVEVLKEMDAVMQVAHSRGRQMSMEDAFKRALAILHPDVTVTAERKRISEGLRKRQTMTMTRPSTRNGSVPKGDLTALQAARQKLQEFGVNNDYDELQDFPD